MQSALLIAFLGVAFAIPAPVAVQSPADLHHFGLLPEEVRISNVRVTKDLVTRVQSNKSPLRWKPTSVTVNIKWDGIPVSCTCFKPKRAHQDICNDPQFEMHMESPIEGKDPKVVIIKKEGQERVPIHVELNVYEGSCSRQGLNRKICEPYDIIIKRTGRPSKNPSWRATDLTM